MYSILFTGYFKSVIPVNSMKLPGDPWDNRWSGFYRIAWNFSMEFHANWCFTWTSMGNVLILHANIFHGNLWRNFDGIPWKLMS